MNNFKVGEIVNINSVHNTRRQIFVAKSMIKMVGNSYQIESINDNFVMLKEYWFATEDVEYAYGGKLSSCTIGNSLSIV